MDTPDKPERIAGMRHELAELQRQLLEAQQRIATELEGRAEDADRFEELESRMQDQEVEAAAQIALLTAERDEGAKTRARLEGELEVAVRKQRDLASQLDEQASALVEASSRLGKLDAEIEEMRRAFDGGRAKAQALAKQLASLGQELGETVVTADPRPAPPARAGAPSRPPPPPPPVAASRPPPPPPPPVTPEKGRSSARSPLLLIGGIAVGVAATIAVVKLKSDRAGEAPTAALSAAAPAEEMRPADAAPAARVQPAAYVEVAASEPRADTGVANSPPQPATQGAGIIVLPPEADGHRVFVDGRQMEVRNGRVEVPCGLHAVQIGSQGDRRDLDVACDGETSVP